MRKINKRRALDISLAISDRLVLIDGTALGLTSISVKSIIKDWSNNLVVKVYAKKLKTTGKTGDIIEMSDKILIQYNTKRTQKALCVPFAPARLT